MMDVGNSYGLKGFTLVELLVSLVVGAILLTVAVPSFKEMMVRNRMATEYNNIVSGLNFARSEAIKRRSEIVFDVTGASPWSFQVVSDGNVLLSKASGDTQTFLSDADYEVTFNSLGRREGCVSTSGDCSVTLSHVNDGAVSRELSLNIMGVVVRGASS